METLFTIHLDLILALLPIENKDFALSPTFMSCLGSLSMGKSTFILSSFICIYIGRSFSE